MANQRTHVSPWPLAFVANGNSRVANPFSPYKVFPLTAFKKRPETQICPKFIPTIVFWGSIRRDPNLSKSLPKNWKTTISGQIFKFSANFWQIQVSPCLEPRKTIVGTIFGQIWGSGVFECCKGKKGSQFQGAITIQRFGSVRLRFGGGTVRAVPVSVGGG